ncbi:TetR/AcrR family transcriptional regulator [Actinomadura coerulea]|uniref:TetR/AcrR family transcriptional regulator n=1 Tax=Actinomadura coerulea TaxID=46159 RepID=UPI00342173FC
MSPRKSAVDALTTRDRILDHALRAAATRGLEGVTIGTLAAKLGMSKAGVLGHFGTKEALQIAVLHEAADRFRQRVPVRAAAAAPGLPRVLAAHTEWFAHMAEDSAGCLMSDAAAEFDARPGLVRDTVLAAMDAWTTYLRRELETAQQAGDLPGYADLDQLLFELGGAALATARAIGIGDNGRDQGDRDAEVAARRGRHAVEKILASPYRADLD